MLSNHIQDLMTAAKAKPNGEWRNKIISHLKDALAASKMLEDDEAQAIGIKRPGSALNGQLGHVSNGSSDCICPEGARSSHCPVHGDRLHSSTPRPPLPPANPTPTY